MQATLKAPRTKGEMISRVGWLSAEIFSYQHQLDVQNAKIVRRKLGKLFAVDRRITATNFGESACADIGQSF
jgi:hypothetical protein